MRRARSRRWDYVAIDEPDYQGGTVSKFTRCSWCGYCVNIKLVRQPNKEGYEPTFTEEIANGDPWGYEESGITYQQSTTYDDYLTYEGKRLFFDKNEQGCPNCGTLNYV